MWHESHYGKPVLCILVVFQTWFTWREPLTINGLTLKNLNVILVYQEILDQAQGTYLSVSVFKMTE